MRLIALTWLLGLLVLFIGACENDAVSPEQPEVTLFVDVTAEPAIFSAGESVTLTVLAENPTESRIVFGMGSSTCQLLSVVRFKDEDRGISVSRVCTADMSPWSLDPGERISESWVWTGEVVVDGVRQTLPLGTYELRGVAGDFIGSPISVEITN